jgi:hypothetical protein
VKVGRFETAAPENFEMFRAELFKERWKMFRESNNRTGGDRASAELLKERWKIGNELSEIGSSPDAEDLKLLRCNSRQELGARAVGM